MKSIYSLIFLFAALFSLQEIQAQKPKVLTAEFKVHGVCNQCKARIENAAYIKGVKHCEWNKATETITVDYKPEKVSLDKIHESIAEAGHATSEKEASIEAYEKLPKCCAYKDSVHKH